MKTFNTMQNVGKAKYAVNFHDGIKKHADGSNFFDIAIFSNKRDVKTFTDNLKNNGYIQN